MLALHTFVMALNIIFHRFHDDHVGIVACVGGFACAECELRNWAKAEGVYWQCLWVATKNEIHESHNGTKTERVEEDGGSSSASASLALTRYAIADLGLLTAPTQCCAWSSHLSSEGSRKETSLTPVLLMKHWNIICRGGGLWPGIFVLFSKVWFGWWLFRSLFNLLSDSWVWAKLPWLHLLQNRFNSLEPSVSGYRNWFPTSLSQMKIQLCIFEYPASREAPKQWPNISIGWYLSCCLASACW